MSTTPASFSIGTNFCCWCPCGKLDNERISDHLVALATNIGNGEAVAKAIWDAQKKWLSAQGFKVPTAKAFTQFQADVKNGSLKGPKAAAILAAQNCAVVDDTV
eukprot:SAG31_NODE_156_length_22055_cov_105.227728_14_plen_104_part_00